MSRGPRVLPTSGMLHIICRGNNGVRVFRNRYDFAQFSNTLRRYTENSQLFIHNYVLMHTHVHLLAWVEDTAGLAKIIKSTLLAYHYYYRRRYNYCGHLWHSRFRSKIIDRDEYWAQCGRYIELNPVYAGMCQIPEEYCWSSYRYYAYGQEDVLLKPVKQIGGTASRENGQLNKAYREFIYAGIDLDYQLQKKRYELEAKV